jgi:DNA-directed RNA polymerase subunit L
MAKQPSKEEDEEDDFDEDLFDDGTADEYPKVSESSSSTESSFGLDESETEEEEEFEFELEEPEVKKDYKHLKLEIKKGLNENDYVLLVTGQSHGFCNALVKHLLSIDGVVSSAYRVTVIKPPEIFIRLKNGSKINDVLFQAIEALRNEVKDVEKLFKKLM